MFSRRPAVERRCILITVASKRENGRENTIYPSAPLSFCFFWLLICCKRVQILCLCKCHRGSFDKESLSFCLHLQKTGHPAASVFCVSCRNKDRCMCVRVWGRARIEACVRNKEKQDKCGGWREKEMLKSTLQRTSSFPRSLFLFAE